MDALHQPASSPGRLDRREWWATLRRTVREFSADNLTDWAAALTYYGVLSIFPGLLLLASVLGLIGRTAIDPLIDSLSGIAPGPARQILTDSLRGLDRAGDTAGTLAIIGLAGALWSASGYVGAFMRASNSIYDVPEGRPIWKTLPLRVAVTVAVGVMLAASALIVVFTGEVAEWLGGLIGAGDMAIAIWGIAKWPVLALLVSAILAILYWASPNARQAGIRWISPGGVLAVVLWVVASLGFAVYAANFGSYNKTYGTLGGVAVFLVWLWISNIAILLGAELDAELHRTRAITGGHPADEEPYVPLRDTAALDERQRAQIGETATEVTG
jgi:membrane protein